MSEIEFNDGAGARDRTDSDVVGGLRRGQASATQVTLLGLSGQQLVPSLGLAGGYLLLYSGNGSWLAMSIAAAAAFCIGLMVTVFARRYIASGSLMSYVGIVFGPHGRSVVAAGYIGGFLAAAAAVSSTVVLFSVSFLERIGWDGAASPLAQSVQNIFFALLAALFAYRGLDTSIKVTTLLSLAALPPVLYVTIAPVVRNGIDLGPQFSLDGVTTASIVSGVVIALAYFVGFEGLASLAAETDRPKRNVPRVLFLVLGITTVTYVVGLFLQIPTLTRSADVINDGASPTTLLADASDAEWLAAPLDLLMAASTLASLIALLNYGSRIVATAAEDRLMPKQLAAIHSRFGSPNKAIMFITAFACLVPLILQVVAATPPLLSSTYLYTLYSYFFVVPYVVASVAAVVVLVRERRAHPAVVAVIAIGALTFAFLLAYEITSDADDTVLDALPWLALATTAVLYAVFVLAGKSSSRTR